MKWISEEPEEEFAGEEKIGLQGGQAPGRLIGHLRCDAFITWEEYLFTQLHSEEPGENLRLWNFPIIMNFF